MTLILEIPRELEARLRQQAEQEGLDEAVVAVRALNDQLASIPPLSLLTDAEVLERIRLQGFPNEFWQRYHALLAHVRNGTINDALREEFIGYRDQVEMAAALRLRYIAELARRHGLSYEATCTRFGVGPFKTHDVS